MLSVVASPDCKSMCVILLSLALVFVYKVPTISANYEHFCDPDSFTRQPLGHCGDQLADNINFLCEHFSGGFLGKYVVKRSYPRNVDKELNDLLVNKKDAFSFLAKRQSVQNVVCECCINSCSVMELLQYCELPNIRRVRSEFPKSKK